MDSFYANENVCKGCEINLPENQQARDELNGLCFDVSKQGVSVIAREVATNRIVGVMFNKIQVSNLIFSLCYAKLRENFMYYIYRHYRQITKKVILNYFETDMLNPQTLLN